MNITTTIEPSVVSEVYSDALCLTRNLLTFLCNACNHTADGSISVHCSVIRDDGDPESKEAHPMLEFAVSDTGSGLRLADTAREGELWDPFVLSSSPRQSTRHGLGLGLFVVSRQCEAMGGSCGMKENSDGNPSPNANPNPTVSRLLLPCARAISL